MTVQLAIENLPDATLLVTRFLVHKQLQKLFTCRFAFKWFEVEPLRASELPGRQFSLKWQQGIIFSGIIESVQVYSRDDHLLIRCDGCSHLHAHIGQTRQFRAYQIPNQRLLDVIQQIPGVDVVVVGDRFGERLKQPFPLAVQYDETCFEFASRLLARFGIPLLPDEERQRLIIGCQKTVADQPLAYSPSNDPFFSLIRQDVTRRPSHEERRKPESYSDWRQSQNSRLFHEQVPDMQQCFHAARQKCLEFSTTKHDFHPGDLIHGQVSSTRGVQNSNDAWRVQAVTSTWRYPQADVWMRVSCRVNSENMLVPDQIFSPLPPRLLGTVSQTNGDPEKLGRIQVQLFTELPTDSKDKPACWVPVITPYQGAFDGFCFLPEKGNQVLLECLDPNQGLWAVTGTLRTRDNPVSPKRPETVKVLQTSRRNSITFESRPSPDKPAQEKITLQNGINTLEFTSTARSGSVILSQNNTPIVSITLKGPKRQTVEISSLGDLVLRAGGNLKLRARKGLDVKVAKKGVVTCGSKLVLQEGKATRGSKLVLQGDEIQATCGGKLVLKGGEIHLN